MTIKESIQYLCQENNMSISRLEKELGFGNRTIGKWNKAAPSVDKLIKVANYFHVSLDWLTGLDKANKPEPVDVYIRKSGQLPAGGLLQLSADERAMIKKYRALDQRGKDTVDDTLQREYRYTDEARRAEVKDA